MHAIFLADAHLNLPEEPNYRTMLRFLDGLPDDIDTLFILGDFFEFWIGYPTVPFPRYQLIVDSLTRLTMRGVRLVFLEGNHDFHMGPVFRTMLQAEIHPGPATVNIDGKEFSLCHGDQVKADYRYDLLRGLLHSFITRWLIKIVPATITDAIGAWMGRRSKAAQSYGRKSWDPAPLIRSYAAKQHAAGCDVVITGHFHTPFIEDVNGKTIVALGDWINQFSYAEWQDGSLTLKSYS